MSTLEETVDPPHRIMDLLEGLDFTQQEKTLLEARYLTASHAKKVAIVEAIKNSQNPFNV